MTSMQSFTSFTTLQAKVFSEKFITIKDDILESGILEKIDLSKPVVFIGSGSNIIFTQTFQGTVVVNATKSISISSDDNFWFVKVSSGYKWHDLVEYCLNAGIYGLETLALIPGTLGGAVIGNIGAYGNELSDFIEEVTYLDLTSRELKTITKSDCQFSYRNSIFKTKLNDFYIYSVVLRLNKSWKPNLSHNQFKGLDPSNVTAQNIYDIVVDTRSRKLPNYRILGNVGSFFMNPIIPNSLFSNIAQSYCELPHWQVDNSHTKLSAAWLIEQAGMKGFSVGQAQVYPKHALILINNANGELDIADFLLLAKEVQKAVFTKFLIKLTPEVRFYDAHGEVNAYEFISNYNL